MVAYFLEFSIISLMIFFSFTLSCFVLTSTCETPFHLQVSLNVNGMIDCMEDTESVTEWMLRNDGMTNGNTIDMRNDERLRTINER